MANEILHPNGGPILVVTLLGERYTTPPPYWAQASGQSWKPIRAIDPC